MNLERTKWLTKWPGTAVPDTTEWSTRCRAELCRLDPLLSVTDAALLADDMATEAHWRARDPEAAAKLLFSPPKLYTAW